MATSPDSSVRYCTVRTTVEQYVATVVIRYRACSSIIPLFDVSGLCGDTAASHDATVLRVLPTYRISYSYHRRVLYVPVRTSQYEVYELVWSCIKKYWSTVPYEPVLEFTCKYLLSDVTIPPFHLAHNETFYDKINRKDTASRSY